MNQEPLDWERRNRIWKSQPREARKMILQGSAEALMSCEPDISTEQLLQRLQDTFGAEIHEVVSALKDSQEIKKMSNWISVKERLPEVEK